MSILIKTSNFANNAAALEKSLRLAQSLAMIGATIKPGAPWNEVAPYVMLRSQFNVARRFFRLHKWIDMSAASLGALTSTKPTILRLLDTTKFAFLAIYFFMEMLCITDVLGVTKWSWGPWLIVQSNKFWFLGLVFSILGSLWQWLFDLEPHVMRKQDAKRVEEEKIVMRRRSLPLKSIVADGFDLFIPGSITGWVDVTAFTVSAAMTISTILQLNDMWIKIQAQAASQSRTQTNKKNQ